MRDSAQRLLGIVGLLVVASVVGAQKIPTGTLRGTVTDGDAPLPGVTVTLSSPAQQGTRVTTSTVNGDYLLDLLPPGSYAVRFALDGFQTIDTTIRISADLTSTVDAELQLVTTVAEEITVTGRNETISTTATAATTVEAALVHTLPVSGDASSYVTLAPGTVTLDSGGRQQLAGAVAAENLYLLNGAVASESLTATFMPLFIEDAIQETSTTLANVSAELGRFTGGVVSVLTRSGGNELHGSLRLNLTNPRWTAATPLTTERTDTLDQLWEGTFGGYILKNRLWFFAGGRTASKTTSTQTYGPVSIPLDRVTREDRYEAKLTYSPSASHRFIGSYLDRNARQDNYYYSPIPTWDLDSFYDRSIPMDIVVGNYVGVLSDRFFVEGQYSARHTKFVNSGGRFTDIARGTPVYDLTGNAIYNSPVFCAVCPGAEETRNNQDVFVKGSAFLSSERAGSHDLRVGVDAFDDVRTSNNWQSGSGYFLNATSVSIVGTGTDARYYPVILPDSSYLEYFPISQRSKGTHLRTYSAFVNDAWRLSSAFTFNLGLRFDQNDTVDASGTKVADDSKWSPRLSVAWDPRGDGVMQLMLGYAQYVASMSNQADSQSTGGQPAYYALNYMGPPINADGNQVETREALRQVFAWLDSIGGVLANPDLWLDAWVPGYQVVIGDDLRSPATTQWSLGLSHRLGSRGLVRLDLVDKRWDDFYAQRVDLTTGTSHDPLGNVYDRVVIENTSKPERTYQAAMLQAETRLGARLRLGGNYTWARLFGNDGATIIGGSTLQYYPEYRDLRWFAPKGCLAGDRRHKLMLFASWDAVSRGVMSLNLGALHSVQSGLPYGAKSGSVLVAPYVTNPGYATPPKYTSYWFTRRHAFRTSSVSSTDLAVTATLRIARVVEFYLKIQVQNVLDNQAAINVNQVVYTNAQKPKMLARFNPFTDTPREWPQGTTCNLADGTNWQKGPSFGRPTQATDYQTPRTYMVNVGLRL